MTFKRSHTLKTVKPPTALGLFTRGMVGKPVPFALTHLGFQIASAAVMLSNYIQVRGGHTVLSNPFYRQGEQIMMAKMPNEISTPTLVCCIIVAGAYGLWSNHRIDCGVRAVDDYRRNRSPSQSGSQPIQPPLQ